MWRCVDTVARRVAEGEDVNQGCASACSAVMRALRSTQMQREMKSFAPAEMPSQ